MKKSLFILLLFTAQIALGQRYPFYNLGVENGLIQSQVRALTQDQQGHLWVGTLGGLSRYDGTSFRNYNVRDGLLDNACYSLATDQDGNIWIGGKKGLSCYNGKEFTHYSLGSSEVNSDLPIKSISVNNDGSLLCFTDSMVFHVIDNKIKEISLPKKGYKIESVISIDDTIWIGTDKGTVFRKNATGWDSLFYYIPGIKKPMIHTLGIYIDKNGRMLFATGNGLFYNNNDSLKVVHIKEGNVYTPPINDITQANDSTLWMGSISGVYRIKDSSFKRFGKKQGFTDNSITSIITDKEGNVWMGSDGQGIYRFSGNQISILNEETGLGSDQVSSFAPTSTGDLYIGTTNAGLFLYSNEHLHNVSLPVKNTYITSLLCTNDNVLWIGISNAGLSKNGLYRKKGKRVIRYELPGVRAPLISCLYYGTDETLYIATYQGLFKYRGQKIEQAPNINGEIYAVLNIGNDSLLIASEAGLQLLNKNKIEPYTTNAAADSSNVRCFVKQDNELWFGSTDNGVIHYNMSTGKSITLNKNSGLQSDFIYNIVADENNNIWVGTGFGIHKIEQDSAKEYNVTFYGKEQGITGMESNQNAACKMIDGSLWFGTTKGAVHIEPSKDFLRPTPVNIVLQSVKLFGDNIRDTTYFDSLDNWYSVPYKLRLPYKKNNITFSFKGISLTGAQQLLYRYHIDGLEDQWSDWTNLSSVTYSALPPNKYILQVECKNSDGSTIKTLSYPFEIVTPIHKTVWFSWLVLAGCILAGITIQYLLNKRKQNRLELVNKLRREEQSKVRQRTAEDFHDEVGNRLTRINVLTNVLKEKLKDLSPTDMRIINQIEDNTAQLYGGTRDILWSLQSTNDNLYEILHRVRDFGTELFEDTNILFEFTGSDNRWQQYRLPLDMSRNFIMIFKEALNNSLKYSEAKHVKIHAELKENDILHVSLKDDGKGFNIEEVARGNGLNNMRNRTKRLKGKLHIDSKPGSGTIISLYFHLPDKNK